MVKDDVYNQNFYELIREINDILSIKNDIFYIGFDFDSMGFEGGIAKTAYYTFVPDAINYI